MQREALRVGDDAGAGKGEQELLGLIELDAGIGEPGDGRREGVDRRLGKGHPVPARGVADPVAAFVFPAMAPLRPVRSRSVVRVSGMVISGDKFSTLG